MVSVTDTFAKARVTVRIRESSSSSVQLERPGFPKESQSERVIQLGIGKYDALNRRVAKRGGDSPGETNQLISDVGRSVQEEPAFSIGADRCGRLTAGPS
jgi:hypothetical protein